MERLQLEAGTFALPDEGVITLTGPDAGKFLQGQSSADFSNPTVESIVPGLFCDIKGRVIADFLAVVADPERIYLRVSGDLIDPLIAHLEKFLMFAKADMERSDLAVFGVIGAAAHRLWGLPVPEKQTATATTLADGFALAREHGQSEILCNPRQAPQEAIAQNTVNSTAPWRAARILAGEARVVAATSGKYLPQDLNYDVAGWVNFNKGCYTGQEVIARLHWRGKPKRRLYRAWLDGSSGENKGLTPGTALNPTGESQAKGSIVNSAACATGTLLAIETTADGLERELTASGQAQHLQPWVER